MGTLTIGGQRRLDPSFSFSFAVAHKGSRVIYIDACSCHSIGTITMIMLMVFF
jgi:hypothetical protein